MDFHKLARRDLQALCKKNQITANGTNIAMANALASLQHVEGLDELMNPPKEHVTQSPETEKPPTSVITRSMTRAATRRRTALESEAEQLQSRTTTHVTMRNRNATAAAADKECKVLNFTETPAVSRTTKRTESASVQQEVEEKVEGEMNEEGDVLADETVNTVAKTRQGKTRASVTQSTRMYTRRSTRLLEKKMNDLKLSDEVTRDLEPIKMSDFTVERDLAEDLEEAIKDEHPSESVNEDLKAEILASEVATLVEVGSKIEAEEESESEVISKMRETKAAESKVDATPVEFENDSRTRDSQVIANIQDEKIDEVDESLVGQLQKGLTSVKEASGGYGCEELTLQVAPANGDDISELTSLVTSLKLNCLEVDCNKDLDGGGADNTAVPDENDVVLDGYLADSDSVSESTLKVERLNGDGKLESHSDALFEQPNNSIANSAAKIELCDNIGQLFDADVNEAGLAMESPQNQKSVETVDVQIANGACKTVKDSNLNSPGDSKVELTEEDIFSKKASKGPLSPLSVCRLTELPTPLKSSSKKMQLKDENKENIGEGVEFVKKIITRLPVADEDNPAPTPLKNKSLAQLKKLLRKKIQVSNKMQLKDENKENIGEGVEFVKKIITSLPVADEDTPAPTPPKNKSLTQLKKLLRKKIQMKNAKRHALQMVPENNSMPVAVENDD